MHRPQMLVVAIAGLLSLTLTVFGCFAALGLDLNVLADQLTAASLLLALPVFLVSLSSRRFGAIAMWAFFIFQWIERSWVSRPPRLLSPVDNWYGGTVLIVAVLLSFGWITKASSNV